MLWLAAAALCAAASVTLAWDANTDAVIRYDVSVAEVFGMGGASYRVTQPTVVITGLTPGAAYLFSVVAVGAGGLVSEAATLGHTLPVPQVRRTIQYSTDLIHWTDIQSFTGPPPPREFLRFKIVTP